MASENEKKPEAPTPKKSKLVKVKVVGPQPLGEDGVAHEKGAVFEATPERRAALGAHVTDVE